MSGTGYSPQRAQPHDEAVDVVVRALRERGYGPITRMAVDGHRPDLRLASGNYVDVKTGEPNLAIEVDSLNTYRRIEAGGLERIYIVHVQRSGWWVHTTDSVTAGIRGGPLRHSGNGSNDDWYKSCNRGTPFNDFFPPLAFGEPA